MFYAVSMYYHKLNKGQDVYFVSYKVKWITFTVYLAIALFLTCGEYPQGPRREMGISRSTQRKYEVMKIKDQGEDAKSHALKGEKNHLDYPNRS